MKFIFEEYNNVKNEGISKNSQWKNKAWLEHSWRREWTGENDFGHRAYISEILINMGQVSLLFNNDTGEFEWVDFGYGNFDTYCDNPYGIVAEKTQEFLNKFKLVDIGID